MTDHAGLMNDLKSRTATLHALHRSPEILVLANVWDVASARTVAASHDAKALVPGKSLSPKELQELGVARVSTGPHTQRVALTALQDAASALFSGGILPVETRALN